MGARRRSESKAKPLSFSFKTTLHNPDLWTKSFCQSDMQPELAKAKQQEETLVLLLTESLGVCPQGRYAVPSELNHATSKSIVCLI